MLHAKLHCPAPNGRKSFKKNGKDSKNVGKHLRMFLKPVVNISKDRTRKHHPLKWMVPKVSSNLKSRKILLKKRLMRIIVTPPPKITLIITLLTAIKITEKKRTNFAKCNKYITITWMEW